MRPLHGEMGGRALLLLSAGSALLLAACGPMVSGSQEPPAASPANSQQTIAPTAGTPAIPTVSTASAAATPAPTPTPTPTPFPQLGPSPPPRPAPNVYPIRVKTPPGQLMAPGTCVGSAPTQADRHQVIFIDPGHGGYAPGASGTLSDGRSVLEKNVTLDVALRVRDLLRGAGFTVVMSRTNDTTVARMSASDIPGGTMTAAAAYDDIAARVACANSASAAVLVNLHFNSSSDPGTGGTETFYDDARRFSPANVRLAQRVQSAVVASLHTAGFNTPDRGVLADSRSGSPALTPLGAAYNHYLELGPAYPNLVYEASGMPGVIAEMLFISNPREADISSSPLGQQALARGIARGVTDYVGSPA